MTVTPPVDPAVQPSAEWDMITLKWLGRIFTGTVVGGELTLGIDRKQPMLYDGPVNPVTILPAQIKAPLSTITLVDGGESREYMYVAVNVPASDDPDIIGTGFTYTASIKLASGQTYGPYTFTVPHDTPGGVLWLNKVTSATPYPGEALPQITKAQFDAAVARIDALELGGGSGGGGEVTLAQLNALALRVVAVETTPPNHAGRHATGGGDAVALAAGQVTSGTFAAARLGTGTADVTRVLYGDGTWKPAPSGGGSGDDPAAVKLTGAQTIDGVKTFTSAPAVPDASFTQAKTAGLTTALSGLAPKASPTFTGTVAGVTKAHVGLGNVDNTADTAKSIAGSQLTGPVPVARLGSGTADATRVLYGDGTWKVAPVGGGDDTNAVKLTGAQTVAGVKTFTDAPAVPDSSFTVAKTTGLQAALDATVRTPELNGTQFDGGVCFFGESTTAFGEGYVPYAVMKSNGRLWPQSVNSNHGQSTPYMLTVLAAQVLAGPEGVVVIMAGVNDASQSTPVSTYGANITSMVDQCHAAGKAVVLCTVTPHDTPTIDAYVRLYNAWLSRYCQQKSIPLVDVYQGLASTTGGWAAGLNVGDGAHPSSAGNKVIGELVASALMEFFYPLPPVVQRVSGSPNTQPNGLFLIDTNSDGVPDPCWSPTPENFSLVADPAGFNWCRLTVSANEKVFLNSDDFKTVNGDFSAGDRFRFSARVRTGQSGNEDRKGASAAIVFYTAAYAVLSNTIFPSSLGGLSQQIDGAFVGEVTAPAGSELMTWKFYSGSPLTEGADNGTYDIAMPTLLNLTKLGI